MKAMKENLQFRLILLGLASLFCLASPAFAAITARPVTGQSELSFQVNPGSTVTPAEVTISITNPLVRYEVRQELIMSPSSGQYQIDWRSFSMRGIRRSLAAGGTFYAGQDAPMPLMTFDPIYTNINGLPEQFTLVYYVNLPASIPAGSYRGRLKYTFVPLTAGAPQAYAFLNILVNVGQQPAAGPQKADIEIKPLTGLNAIMLNSAREDMQNFDVQVTMNARPNNLFTLSEIIREPMMSSEGNQLDYAVVDFQTRNVRTGMGVPVTPLSIQQQRIFTSGPGGEAPDSFIVNYKLGDLSGEKAGRYKTRIQYMLEQSGRPITLLKALDLQIEIERIFELVITPEEQRSAIEFRDLKPSEEPKESTVTVEIKTNIGRQYQVSQNVFSELSDKEGKVYPSKYFTMRQESISTKGKLKYLAKSEVKKGDTVLFVSDAQGSPDKFKLIYELNTSWDIKAGNYSSRVAYSLAEL